MIFCSLRRYCALLLYAVIILAFLAKCSLFSQKETSRFNQSNIFRSFLPLINAKVIITNGYDAFIQGPNCNLFAIQNSIISPIGGYYYLDDIRYLIKFNILETLQSYGYNLKNFNFSKAVLILKTSPTPITTSPLHVKIYPLNKPFFIRNSQKGWYYSSDVLMWNEAGGDYKKDLFTQAIIPATSSQYIYIDITNLVKYRFSEYKKTGKWFDPGFIIIRDVSSFGSKGIRCIYNFNALNISLKSNKFLLSPQLYLK